MSVLIVHVTDIHLTVSSQAFLPRAERIVEAALSPVMTYNDVHIVVSGDLANTGQPAEFEVVKDFLGRMAAEVHRRTGLDAKILVCAGNHDCDFTGDQSLRNLTIDSIRKDSSKLTPQIAQTLATPLTAFRALQVELTPDVVQEDPWLSVWSTSSPTELQYVLLNSSVLSVKSEDPGKLYVPVPKDQSYQSDRRTIYVMHHPFNWLQPDNARELAQHASAAADLFMLGHEHELHAQTTRELYEDHAVTYLKGHVLRETRTDANSAFQTVLLDSEKGFLSRSYRWSESKYEPWAEKSLQDFTPWPSPNGSRKLGLTPEAYKDLSSTGANYTHRRKETITLPDIFVWPNLRPEKTSGVTTDMLAAEEVSAESIIDDYSLLPSIVVIRGGEHSGKSALARMAALSLARKGIFPILLTASGVSSWREKSLNERIDGVVDQMYGRSKRDEYKQLSPEKKVLIIDDFDLSQVTKGYFDGLRALQQTFGKIFLMLDFYPGLEVPLAEFLHDECFIKAAVLDLLNSNYAHRLDLIERWMAVGAEDQREEERKLISARLAKVVDETLGRNLIPSVPVFVLIILQRVETTQDLDTVVKSGSQGFLYESMIRQALTTRVRVFGVVTSLAYLTALAAHLKNIGQESLSQTEFEAFHVFHCEKYAIDASLRPTQAQLVAADILEERNEVVKFKYPFHNYYFTARALQQIDSWLLLEPEVDSLISAIHTERNANILLFLAHLERNPRIADKILAKADAMFQSYEKADFFQSLGILDEYGSKEIRQIILEGPRQFQLVEHSKDLLAAEASQRELTEVAAQRLRNRLDDALAMNAGFKTLQVLGQILRNHAGEIEREEKRRIAQSCADLGLRIMGFLFATTQDSAAEMIAFRAAQLRAEGKKKTEFDIASEMDSYLPQFVTSIAVGTLIKIANAIGAEDLAPTLNDVLGRGHTSKLLKLTTQLEHFADFPEKELLQFDENVLSHEGYLPNAVMRRFIVRRFYLFPAREELKRAVLARFKIAARPFQFLEQRPVGKE